MSSEPDHLLRLKALSREAASVISTMPSGEVSAMKGLAAQIGESAVVLTRIVQSSPQSVPAVRLARFLTTAETLLSRMETMAGVYGFAPKASDIDQDAEADLTHLVGVLTTFSDSAKADAIAAIRTDLQVSADTVAAWNLPATTKLAQPTSDVSHGELVSGFMTRETAVQLPAVVVNKGPFSRFLDMFRRTQTAPDVTSGPRVVRISDDRLNAMFKRASNNGPSHDKSHQVGKDDEKIRWSHPSLEDWGLDVISVGGYVWVFTAETPPITMTKLWAAKAEDMGVKPSAFKTALSFRDDPDFRSSLITAMISSLSSLEMQVQAGVPLPIVNISDPVINAAINGTLNNMGMSVMTSRNDRDTDVAASRIFDPFGLGDDIRQMHKSNVGLQLVAMNDGMALITVKTDFVPTGLSAILHTTKQRTDKLLKHPDMMGRGARLIITEQGMDLLDGKIAENLRSFKALYSARERRGARLDETFTMSRNKQGHVIVAQNKPEIKKTYMHYMDVSGHNVRKVATFQKKIPVPEMDDETKVEVVDVFFERSSPLRRKENNAEDDLDPTSIYF